MGDAPPFESLEEELAAETKLDAFMADVLIPLAAANNAVVFADASNLTCALSRSFTRMCVIARTKWSNGKPPFTVVSGSNAMAAYYANPDPNAEWKKVRAQSATWQLQDATLKQAFRPEGTEMTSKDDLDPNAMCIVLVNTLGSNGEVVLGHYDRLIGSLVRHLCATIPSLLLKTGMNLKGALEEPGASTLGAVVARLNGGAPVLFIDVRPRKPLKIDFDTPTRSRSPAPGDSTSHEGGSLRDLREIHEARRQMIIEAAKAQLNEWCDGLMSNGMAETFDVCSLAFLHDALTGDGEARTIERAKSQHDQFKAQSGGVAALPLHAAIVQARDDSTDSVRDGVWCAKASGKQTSDAAAWLTNRIFADAWGMLDDYKEREARGETIHTLYAPSMYAQTAYATTLLAAPNFYHVNLHDMEGAQRLVRDLVKLDRLPDQNPLEGLLLLRSAWDGYDVAMLMSARYKRWCKALFAAQLVLQFLVVAGSVVSRNIRELAADAPSLANVTAAAAYYATDNYRSREEAAELLVHIVFGLSVGTSLIVSIDGILNPKARWRQLRSGAGSIRSSIWLYRTRVAPFDMDESQRDSRAPELALMTRVNEWTGDLVSGAGLKTSSLHRRYPPSTYRHMQHRGSFPPSPPNLAGAPPTPVDDFHSPTKPDDYIELRVCPTLDFYARRIPINTRRSYALKVGVLLLGVTASVLARYNQLSFVTVVTAAASALTSWNEFSAADAKVERYSTSIVALKMLLSWWESQSDVQRASKDAITHLVGTAEAIISEEQLSWTTTQKGSKPSKQQASDERGGAQKAEPEGAQAAGPDSRRARVSPT